MFEKKNWRPEFGPTGPKSGLKLGFFPFSQFWLIFSLFFFEIAYNDSLQQCLTSSGVEIYGKKIGDPNLGQKCQNHA